MNYIRWNPCVLNIDHNQPLLQSPLILTHSESVECWCCSILYFWMAAGFMNGDFSRGQNIIGEIHIQAYIYWIHVRRDKSSALEFWSATLYTWHHTPVWSLERSEHGWTWPTFLTCPLWASFSSLERCCAPTALRALCRRRYCHKLMASCRHFPRTTAMLWTRLY